MGDTRPCSNAVKLARNADLFVHEATFSADNEEMAWTYFHSTTVQTAVIANKANVSSLYLTHLSSRYGKEDWKKLVEEARAIFPATNIASDFLEIKIPPHTK